MAGPVSSPRFVGRREELQRLEQALERARAGEGSVVLIGAEAGMGKSRLIGELASIARQSDVTVLVGECLPLGDGELPYAPIVGALRSLVRERGPEGIDALAGTARAEVARLLPELVPVETASSPPVTDGSQARLFSELLSVLVAAARDAPVVLVVEDLHWSDRSTRDFLSFLVRGTRRERLTLIVSYRSDELPRRHPARAFLVELQRSGHAVRIELTPFKRAEIREQVGAIRGSEPEPALVDRLARRAEGNPFFTEELLAFAGGPDTALPDSLRDALLMRIERCMEPTQAVLRAAAVAGREVDDALLAAVAEVAPGDLSLALREAVDNYVLVPGSAGYAFRHALLREAVYADLLPGERQALHLTIAHVLGDHRQLGRSAAPRSAELAHHFYAAGALPEALAASVDAGISAERTYAFGEALLHYERVLEIWDSAAGMQHDLPLDQLEVWRRSAEAAYLSGDTEHALELARETLTRVDRDDPVAASLAHERLGRYLWTGGRGEDALPEYRCAVELMPVSPPSSQRAYVLAAEAQVLMLCGRNRDSRAECAEALEIARSVGDRRVEANVLNTMIPLFSLVGETDAATDAMARALVVGRELGLGEEVGRSYVNGSDALDQAGRLQDSIHLAREGIGDCARFGADALIGDFLRGEIASRLLRTGAWDEAQALLDELLEHGLSGTNAGLAYGNLGWLHAHRGEHEAAARALERADREVSRGGGSMWYGQLGEAEAANQLWAGHPQRAIEIVDQRLELIGSADGIFFIAPLYDVGARACADLALRSPGDDGVRQAQRDRAAALLQHLDGAIEQLSGSLQPRVLANRAACAAELARIDRPDGDAWAAAEGAWQACGDPYLTAYARWRRAEAILAVGGDRRDAEALARAAYEAVEPLRARPLLEQLHGLARRARLDLTDQRGGELVSGGNASLERLELTPRELDVLALLGDGMTNREIAAQLFISDKTASVHVSRILTKLSVPNRAAAAAAAQHLGINPATTPGEQRSAP